MKLHLLSPGDPRQRTGGYLYNARVVAELRREGWSVEIHALPGPWPMPGGVDQAARQAQLDQIPDGAPVLADGLCWTGLGGLRGTLAARCRVSVLLHSALGTESAGGALDPALQAAEKAALAEAHGWVATSQRTAAFWPSLDIAIAEPGTAPAPPARGSPVCTLLCIGTLTPRKGHPILLRALAMVPPPWRLLLAGSTARDPAHAQVVRAQIAALGLGDRVALLGECSGPSLEDAYGQADVLVSAAHFEGWGMGLAEGMARHLPVVSTPAGLLDTRPDAACLVPAGDVAALAAALSGLIHDPAARQARRRRSIQAAGTLPTWADAARAVLQVWAPDR